MADKPSFIRRPELSPTEVRQIARDYRCRRESLLAVDEGVERIVGALRRAGELDRTLIVFTSDNGFLQGEHRLKTGKINLYEAARVPLILRGPGVPAGRRVDDQVANIDLAPTIADAGGAVPRREVDGRSLLPLARRPGSAPNRDILIENRPLGDKLRRYVRYAAVRTPRYVYAEYVTGDRELYDLAADPHQLRNRAGQPAYAAIQGRLAPRLAALRDCRGESCRTP